MAKRNELTHHVQNFFQTYLPVERNLRAHTISSYRDTVKLYLKYLSRSGRRRIHELSLEQLTAKSVLAFIGDSEKTRNNSVKTTNQRLAVLKSFFTYMLNQDPTRANQYERIFHLKARRAPYRPVEYLFKEELEAVLGAVDHKTKKGQRDYAILLFLYNTGARAQELCDLNFEDFRAEKPYLASLRGKGNKTRQVPLWENTIDALQTLMQRAPRDNIGAVFTNQHGERLTRFGLRYLLRHYVKIASRQMPVLSKKRIGPHTIRHTTAMHLLQSGVDITIIKAWLGHVDLSTTHGYIEIDLKMKEAALKKTKPKTHPTTWKQVERKKQDLIQWLESFGDM